MQFNTLPDNLSYFVSLPEPIVMHIFSYCDGRLTATISLVCKRFLLCEQAQPTWQERSVRLMGKEMSKLFFDTYKCWKLAYINFTQMSQEGTVISPTEIICIDGTKITGSFFHGKLNGDGKKNFKEEENWPEYVYEDVILWEEGKYKNGILINGIKYFSDHLLEKVVEDPSSELSQSPLTVIKTEGELDSTITGQGKIILSDGTIKEGFFINGQLEGPGTITCPDQRIIEGKFQQDKLNGKGKVSYPDHRIIEGNFYDGKLDGQGKMISFNKTIKEGLFKGGYLNGLGQIIDSTGIITKGFFLKDCLHGEGTIISRVDRFISKGWFQNGKLNGIGEISLFNGEIIEKGEFENGKLHGQGMILFSSGKKIEGSFRNGVLHGPGQIICSNKKIKKGNFENGQLKGLGTVIYPDQTEKEVLFEITSNYYCLDQDND